MLRCVAFASTLVEMHHDTRIDSDPILAFLCIAFLRLIVEKSLENVVRNFLRFTNWRNAMPCVTLWTSLNCILILWIKYSTRSTYGLERFCTLPSRVTLSWSTTYIFLTTVFTIIFNRLAKIRNFSTKITSKLIVVLWFSKMYGLYPSCGIMEFLGLCPRNSIIPHSGYNTHTP